MQISYIVLYASDPAASAAWYEAALGLRFHREQHGANGPVHYAATLDGGVVLELYPAGARAVTCTRIGLSVPDPYDVRPEVSVITDPDGNTIAITVRAARG